MALSNFPIVVDKSSAWENIAIFSELQNLFRIEVGKLTAKLAHQMIQLKMLSVNFSGHCFMTIKLEQHKKRKREKRFSEI